MKKRIYLNSKFKNPIYMVFTTYLDKNIYGKIYDKQVLLKIYKNEDKAQKMVNDIKHDEENFTLNDELNKYKGCKPWRGVYAKFVNVELIKIYKLSIIQKIKMYMLLIIQKRTTLIQDLIIYRSYK